MLMNFRLRAGVTFCDTGGRLVFLDVRRNRYFALPEVCEHAFRRFAAGDALDDRDRIALETIAGNGLLEPCEECGRPSGCSPGLPPTASLLDEKTRPRPAALIGALARLALASVALKARPLSNALQSFERRKAAAEPTPGDAATSLVEVAAAFRLCRLIASPLDRCLPRSLAAAHRLLDRGVPAELVIGVRLRPFAAHCWVRHGPVLVNESLDQVRNFTPILTL
jgi:hypothetical protein